jgi:predicted AAA+ superfamily ATPase
MIQYARAIQPAVEASLFRGKVVVIYGARQVGKTTLVKAILGRYGERGVYLNCDEPDIRDALTNRTSTELRALVGTRTLLVIDEAQRVRDIGLALKLLADNYPDLQVIATGSSSFELSNTIPEPLTGRKSEF